MRVIHITDRSNFDSVIGRIFRHALTKGAAASEQDQLLLNTEVLAQVVEEWEASSPHLPYVKVVSSSSLRRCGQECLSLKHRHLLISLAAL